MAEPSLTVVVGHADPLLAELVARAVGADGLRVVATLQSASAFEQPGVSADVAVLDVELAPASDLSRLVGRLLTRGCRSLALASAENRHASAGLLLAGATGSLLVDDSSAADLRAAIRQVAAGTTALHPDVAHAVLELWRSTRRGGPATSEPDRRAALTEREVGVLEALADGLTTRLAARRLGVAEKTVEAHKSRIYAKLGVRNQAEAVHAAVGLGVLAAQRGRSDV